MRVIVTGGAGFVGSAVCRHFIDTLGFQVANIDKLTYAGNLASLRDIDTSSRYRFIHADICDIAALRQLFREFAPEAVIHLAAESHVDRSISGASPFIHTNVVGTFSLLEAALDYWTGLPDGRKSAFRFLHVSTDEVYGSLEAAGLFNEESRYDPSSPYSASKAASDHMVAAWNKTYGLPTIITNCSNNFGPYHFPEKLIPLTILNALEGRPIPVYGTGENVRDWLYVEDHVRALALILANGAPGSRYNIGGGNERRNIDVVESVCASLDQLRPQARPHRDLITHVADRPGHDLRYAIDASRISRVLGWRAQESFESGLKKTVQWFLDNEWWWRPIRNRDYSGERFGLDTLKSPRQET